MLIVITKDESIIQWARTAASGATAWNRLAPLGSISQRAANRQLTDYLSQVGAEEPLCITGHGNDKEVGDEGDNARDWTWTHRELAELLGLGLPVDYRGPILMEVCANTVTDFAAHLVVSLEKLRKLNGVWIYGYNKSVSVRHKFPAPPALKGNLELWAKQVCY